MNIQGGLLMSNSPYNLIGGFCRSRDLNKLYQRILFHRFHEEYQKLIDNYKEREKKDPSDEVKKEYENLLLNENTLTTNVKLATEEINEQIKEQIKKIEHGQSWSNFWTSVLAGVVGSIIFTLLIMISFTLGHNQIKSWINDIYQSDKQIQHTIDEKQNQEETNSKN